MTALNSSFTLNFEPSRSLAFGSGKVRDSMASCPFLNLFKTSNFRHETAGGSAILDDQGYITTFDAGWSNSSAPYWLWAWKDLNPASFVGDYSFTWDGPADGCKTRIATGLTNIVVSDNRIDFTITDQVTSWGLGLTDGSWTGSTGYPTNFRLFRVEDEAALDAGEVFRADWLEPVKGMANFRFMDWLETNSNHEYTWENQTQPDFITYSLVPGSVVGAQIVPYEICARLMTDANVDGWFNLSAACCGKDAVGGPLDFATKFGAWVKSTIPTTIKTMVTCGNETWNTKFDVHDWLLDQALEEGWPSVGSGGYDTKVAYFQKLLAQTFKAVRDGYGAGAESAIVNVAEGGLGQVGNWNLKLCGSPDASAQTLWQTNDPVGFFDIEPYVDKCSVACYFGAPYSNGFGSQIATVDAMLAEQAISGYGETLNQFIYQQAVDAGYVQTNLDVAQRNVDEWAVFVNGGTPLIAYEGGNHMFHGGYSGYLEADRDIIIQALGDFYKSTQCVALYDQMFSGVMDIFEGPFMQFGHYSVPNRDGFWGPWEFVGDGSPNERGQWMFDKLGVSA